MPSDAHSHDHPGDHGRDQRHDHAHRGHAHAHAHAPASPHPPMALPPSFMRFSIGTRLGVVLIASAALWCAVWLAMR